MYTADRSEFEQNLRRMFMHKRAAHAISATAALLLLVSLSAVLHANTSNRQSDVVKTSEYELLVTPLYQTPVMLEWPVQIIPFNPWTQGAYTGIAQTTM